MAVTIKAQGDGHARRRLAAMRRVQAVALDLFERHGFDAVTIEAIAEAAEVGPATVYRHFGEKERIVLWDDYDPMLLEAIAAELAEHDVLTAVRRGLAAALARVYDADRERILRRARLIRATPAVERAAESDQRGLRAALAEVLLRSRRARDPLEAQVVAGAVVAALEAAIDRWLDTGGRTPLARCLQQAFDRLQRLAGARTRTSTRT